MQNTLGVIASWLCLERSAMAAGVNKEVISFYYSWYGDAKDKADWRGIGAVHETIANAADYPAAGAYSSQDPATVTRREVCCLNSCFPPMHQPISASPPKGATIGLPRSVFAVLWRVQRRTMHRE